MSQHHVPIKQKNAMRTVFKIIRQVAPLRFWGGVGVAGLSIICAIGLLALSGWFITATALAGLTVATARIFDVFMPSATIRLLALGRTISRYFERLITHDATLSISTLLRAQLFRSKANQGQTLPSQRDPTRLLYLMTGDLEALEFFYLRLIVPLGAAVLASLFCLILILPIYPVLGVYSVLFLVVVGLGISVLLLFGATRHAFHATLQREQMRRHIIDLVRAQTDLIMSATMAGQIKQIHKSEQRLWHRDLALNWLDCLGGIGYTLAGSLLVSGVIVVLAITKISISVPAATLILLVLLTAMEAFAALKRGVLDYGRIRLGAQRLSQFLTQKSGPISEHSQQSLSAPSAALELNNISYHLPRQQHFLIRNFSCVVGKQERVAFVGPSGSGKTTILKLIIGELMPQSGTISRQKTAWLEQKTALFQDTLRENLLLADQRASDERLNQVMQQAGLQDLMQNLSQGLDTRLGEDGLGLSGGQGRRLALARLLLQDAQLWLLDECTDGLDRQTAQQLIDQLHIIGRDKTWIIATHLRREAQLANRIYDMSLSTSPVCHEKGSPGYERILSLLRAD